MAEVRGTILIVDDLAPARRALARELTDVGFEVVEASDGVTAWEAFCQQEPDAIVTDLVMPRSDGQDLLTRVRARSDVPVVLFSAQGSVDAAVSAVRAGADDFVPSTGLDVGQLVQRVMDAIESRGLAETPSGIEVRLVGTSPAIVRVRQRVAALAPLPTPVLIVGEPGRGRDSVALALHEFGSTASGEFVHIDCRSSRSDDSPPNAAAIYLDGVDSLPDAGQQFWSDFVRQHYREGDGDSPRLLASSADPLLRALAKPGRTELRELLLRIQVEFPSLRERAEDVPAVAKALLAEIGDRVGRPVRLSAAACTLLAERNWQGDVEELHKVLERAVAFAQDGHIRRESLQEVLEEVGESVGRLRRLRERRERDELLDALRATEGNVSLAAERLEKSRSAVYRLIEKYGISLSDARDPS